MRKIRLSDTDLELFDIEISPSDFNFYQKHKDAFRTMWKEQVRCALGDAGPEQSLTPVPPMDPHMSLRCLKFVYGLSSISVLYDFFKSLLKYLPLVVLPSKAAINDIKPSKIKYDIKLSDS